MERYKKFEDALTAGSRIVFFGGAGVSTESGIPDFRSKTGLYNAKENYGASPEELLSIGFFRRDPAAFYKYYRENLIHTGALPNAAHKALAKLESMGRLLAVVTQNIDGLHQAAGSKNVLELHGSVTKNYCTRCGGKYPLDYILDKSNDKNGAPACNKCGGLVRPDVVLYGELLDNETVAKAVAAIRAADMLIVGGTSLAVYPAAGLVDHFSGKTLALINKTATDRDSRADIVIHDALGRVLGAVVGV